MSWQRTREGLLVRGRFAYRVRGRTPWVAGFNLTTTEGRDYLVDNSLASGAAPVLYLALWGSDVTPTESWTGASFDATAGEIMDAPEGYNETARPLWNAAQDSGELQTSLWVNFLTPAEFNIVTATQLTVCGAALLTTDTKGDTVGKLIAAKRFADAPVLLDNHDIFDLRYTLQVQRPA